MIIKLDDSSKATLVRTGRNRAAVAMFNMMSKAEESNFGKEKC